MSIKNKNMDSSEPMNLSEISRKNSQDGDEDKLSATAGEETLPCIVCFEERATSAFPHETTQTCSHMSSICLPCTREYMEMAMETIEYDSPACPECKSRLPPEIIKKFISTETIERYRNHIDAVLIRDEHEFTWCAYLECGSGQLRKALPGKSIRSKKVLCDKCGRISCFNCNIPFEPHNHNCEKHQAEVRRKQEAESLQLPVHERTAQIIQKIINPCPYCKKLWGRSGGCLNLLCDKKYGGCGKQFKWIMPK